MLNKINIKKTLGILLIGVITSAAYYELNVAHDYIKNLYAAIETYESIILEYEKTAVVDDPRINALKEQLRDIDPRKAVYKASLGFSSTIGLAIVLFAVIPWFRLSEKT